MSDSGELATVREQAESDAPTSGGHATFEAQQILAAAKAEAEAVRASAERAAAALVQRAQQQAATIEERARQELFWYRRQLRRERDVLIRSQRALVDQLTMLSGLAVETAKSLYDSPEPSFVDEDSVLPIDDDELLEFAQSEGT